MSIAAMGVSGLGEHRSTKPGVRSSNLLGRTPSRKHHRNASDSRALTQVGALFAGRSAAGSPRRITWLAPVARRPSPIGGAR